MKLFLAEPRPEKTMDSSKEEAFMRAHILSPFSKKIDLYSGICSIL